MDSRSIYRWLVEACLVLGALLVCVAPYTAVAAPAERIMYADVAGRVVDDVTGEPLSGIEVGLLYETVVTNGEGRFLFPKIPLIHSAEISLRVSTEDGTIIGCTVFDVPVKYYPLSASSDGKVAVVVIEPGVTPSVELRLKAVALEEVDAYCADCHGNNPCVETSSFEEVVEGGKDMRGLIVKESELAEFRAQLTKKGLSKDSYNKLRYQDTHPDGMDMYEKVNDTGMWAGQFQHTDRLLFRKVMEGAVEHRFVVCDTCHTRHVPTMQRQFVVMEFEEDSGLCYQCHK
jgi:predicted CXXCH cytochrome family protein